MKKLLLLSVLFLLASCAEPEQAVQHEAVGPPAKQRDTMYVKVIKDLKEIQEAHTDYHTKVNVVQSIWESDLKTTIVPDVSTETKYYVVFTDGTHTETTRDAWLGYSKGDTILDKRIIYYWN